MLTILGANSPSGYEIDHSYMIDSAAAAGLSRFGNNSRNGDTFTISFWVKRTKLGTNQILVCSKAEDSGSNAFVFQFTAADKIQVIGQPQAGTTGAGGNRTVILSTPVYRDPSAWYHIVYRHDTTQGTAGNRHRLYVNGVQQATDTNDALDQNTEFLYFYNASSFPYAIGNDERDNLYGDYYMAEHHYTDGVSNGPDAFGETNDNGVWIPKQYTGSHGTYGHYLKFDNVGGGSGTTAIGGHDYTTGSSSTIGADSSGNDHHFHVQGYGEKNHTEDTPTNNYCVFNPLIGTQVYTAPSYNEGNLKWSSTSNSSFGSSGIATLAPSSGKWYWEGQIKSSISNGVGSGARVLEGYIPEFNNDSFFAGNTSNSGGVGYSYNYNNGKPQTNSQESTTNQGNSVSQNNVVGIAMDLDNGAIYYAINGTWQASSDPESGASKTNAQHSFTVDGSYAPAVYGYSSTIFEMNFGNPMFDISSGNSDANGYGNFEYAVPDGYFALNTKNLAEYG